MERQFTGRHMAAILIASFAVVLAVNLVMARLASSTFGGVVVENSYVASQNFNRWLADAEASRRLGWTVEPRRLADGRIGLTVGGAPRFATASATVRHPVGREADRPVAFVATGPGAYASTEPLPPGLWDVRITIRAGADQWRGEVRVR